MPAAAQELPGNLMMIKRTNKGVAKADLSTSDLYLDCHREPCASRGCWNLGRVSICGRDGSGCSFQPLRTCFWS